MSDLPGHFLFVWKLFFSPDPALGVIVDFQQFVEVSGKVNALDLFFIFDQERECETELLLDNSIAHSDYFEHKHFRVYPRV
jgi:hypothetical protein